MRVPFLGGWLLYIVTLNHKQREKGTHWTTKFIGVLGNNGITTGLQDLYIGFRRIKGIMGLINPKP